MKISGRNKFRAINKDVIKNDVTAKIVMDYKGDELVSVINTDSVEDFWYITRKGIFTESAYRWFTL